MSYISRMNDALVYVEKNLQNEIDYNEIYKIACMSSTSFQRLFLFVTDMTLSEYIKNLRLSSAAQELLTTDDKIIDIAMKYGYESASSFSRAFKALFSETPSNTRKKHISVSFSAIKFQIEMKEGQMSMNEKSIVRIEEHNNERMVYFDVDCYEAEKAAWGKMSEWCKKYVSDRTARRFVGLAPEGHHPDGGQHVDSEEHVKHKYRAMMLLLEDEWKNDEFHGMPVADAPHGLYLVNDVALNQYDAHGKLDMALSMMQASDAFVEFVSNSDIYEFDMKKGVFLEEHVFSEEWFQNGGVPTAFKMWVPVIKKK